MPWSRAQRRVALGIAILVFAGVAAWAWQTGAVTPSSIEAWLESLGPWGPVVFLAAFLAGSMVGLPGMAFVVGARLAFGPWLGFALGYGGGMIAVLAPFTLVRLTRRQQKTPWRPHNRWLRRAVDNVETRPVRAVIALRLVFWFNQPLSYALGVTPIRPRDYAQGCALGLLPIVAAGNLATGWFT
jgi:uncharacterized membrane protein YdjX (TVP38/TMEM64 family)